jgi:hypothetical protein
MCFTVNVNLIKEELENLYGATLIDTDKHRASTIIMPSAFLLFLLSAPGILQKLNFYNTIISRSELRSNLSPLYQSTLLKWRCAFYCATNS